MKLFAVLAVAFALANAQQERIKLGTEICGQHDLTLEQCQVEAKNCLDLGIAFKDILQSRGSVESCASDNGILDVWSHAHPAKTSSEALRDAGATPEVVKAIKRCVLNREGWATDNILDVEKMKTAFGEVIQRDILQPAQQQATLDGLDKCDHQATIDNVLEYILCISENCIGGK